MLCICRLNTSSGGSRGGGASKNNVVLKCALLICTCIYNIAVQNTDFGVLQKSSKHFLISIFFPPGERGTIFIYNIALQNTDFGVLQKSSKHFLISIFFPFGEGVSPSLSHPLATSGLE